MVRGSEFGGSGFGLVRGSEFRRAQFGVPMRRTLSLNPELRTRPSNSEPDLRTSNPTFELRTRPSNPEPRTPNRESIEFDRRMRRLFLLILLCALGVAAAQPPSRRAVSLIVANGIVITIDAAH